MTARLIGVVRAHMIATPFVVKRSVLLLAITLIFSTLYLWADPKTWEASAQMMPWMWVGLALINGLFALLLVLTLHRRNWARWAVVVWSAIGWILTVSTTFMVDVTTLDRLVELVVIAVEVWACAQLLSKASSTWFHAPA